MHRFIAWLNTPVPRKEIPRFILHAFGFCFLWNVLAMSLLTLLNLAPSARPNSEISVLSVQGILLIVIIAPVFEEFLMRLIPIGLAIYKKGVGRLCLLSLVLSSALFGYLHGGPSNLALQGVGGFILGITFIKCGAGSRNYAQGWAASIAVHALFNTVLLVTLLIGALLGSDIPTI